MDSRKFQFLKAVLGEDGARALTKAAERGPELEAALLPRTIMAWLGIYGRTDFEGRIPGVENTYLQFSKSEERFSGSVAVGEEVYSFNDASMLHLGACVAVALGHDHERVGPKLKDLDIQRLGKNIDTLAKARVAIAELQKRVLDPGLGVSFSHEHHDLGDGEMLTHVRAHDPAGQVVGEALFNHHPNGSIVPEGVTVHPDHRRKGIASAIYGHAQKLTGKSVAPSHDQTSMGQALWQGNATQQQFGMAKAEKPQSLTAQQILDHVRRTDTQGTLANVAGRISQHPHWTQVQIPVGDLDIYDPNQPELAQSYAASPAASQPAIVAVPHEAGGWEILDGTHRANAALTRGDSHITAYVPHGTFAKAAMSAGKEGPGPAHAPTQPDQPMAPMQPQPTQTSKGPTVSVHPKLPKLPQPKTTQEVVQTGPAQKHPKAKAMPALKVTKNQAEHECGICGGKQFKTGKFTGCLCFRDLSKSVKTTALDDGYRLEFKADWDKDSILTLVESLGIK